LFIDNNAVTHIIPAAAPKIVEEIATEVPVLSNYNQDYYIDSNGSTHYEDEGAECGHSRY
jgi:hypothetical protein